MPAERVTIATDPFATLETDRPWHESGQWRARWVACPAAGEPPFVTAYRLPFTTAASTNVRTHISADERYELFLDGERVGRGPERGTPEAWFYESYELTLDAGDHVLVARVWSLGERAPFAQLSVEPGFLLAAEGKLHDGLSTGIAPWEAKRLDGYAFLDPSPAWGTGANVRIDGAAYPWGCERGEGSGWRPVVAGEPARHRLAGYEFFTPRRLRPATLPPVLDRAWTGGTVRFVGELPAGSDPAPIQAGDDLPAERAAWTALFASGSAIAVPAHTGRRVLIDLDDYVCAYPEIVTSGGRGGEIEVQWAESLCHTPEPWCRDKGNRDEIECKFFHGVGDTFLPDGGALRRFGTLWWQAGRYIQVTVRTADAPLTIERFALRESRYPLEPESTFAASDQRLTAITPILVRGLQMCAHETYMDCPYYEQLMYAGDTRLEALTTYALTADARLPRKALHLFDGSRLPSGLTQARYPSRVLQIIAPFSLWWVAMVRDYALWRDDRATVDALMPGVRATLEAFGRNVGADGLVRAPEGWNYMDWVPEWQPGGVPPGAGTRPSALLNWQLVLVLGQVADLETALGESELAARARRQAGALAAATDEAFWDDERGLFADDLDRTRFSEHTQCLAILGGHLDGDRRERIAHGLLHDPDLARTTIYFSHYLFETYRELDRVDALFDRLPLWLDLPNLGLKTPLEMPEPSRSDCHAWGAHPLFHHFASILGIRPASLGFRSVEITPRLGPLAHAGGRMVHPQGTIEVDVRTEDDALHGTVRLPRGVTGTLRLGDRSLDMPAGGFTF